MQRADGACVGGGAVVGGSRSGGRPFGLVAAVGLACAVLGSPASAQPFQDFYPSVQGEAPATHEKLARQGAAWIPYMGTETARRFLEAAGSLPEAYRRWIYRDTGFRRVVSLRAYDAMDEADREDLLPSTVTSVSYYEGFRNETVPMLHARALDVAVAGTEFAEPEAFAGAKVFVYEYETITPLMLYGRLGAEVVGSETGVFPRALYDGPLEEGPVDGFEGGPDGSIERFDGTWPGDEGAGEVVGGEVDLIVGLNSFMRGLSHPPPTRGAAGFRRQLFDLGVEREELLATLFDSLKPGGRLVAYHAVPPQRPMRNFYQHIADGRFLFGYDEVVSAGFRVVAWEQDDSAVLQGLVQAAIGADAATPLHPTDPSFGTYTVLERPAE